VPRKVVEFRYQMDGKIYVQKMYEKIIPEDPVMNMARHEAATLKQRSSPLKREMDLQTKLGLVRLNLEI